MVWDRDLRPVGISYGYERSVRAFDVVRIAAAYYAGDHRFDDESRIGAFQASWLIREGAARGGELALSYLQFDDLERLVESRTNRVSEGRLVSDFELLDLQLAGRLPVARGSLEVRLDQVVNLGADNEDRGTRVSLTWSQEIEPVRFEAGLTAQRIQRDAVMAAFNSDDWWFHSAVQGVNAWLAYHPRRDMTTRLGGFSERLDGRDARFERLLLDLEIAW